MKDMIDVLSSMDRSVAVLRDHLVGFGPKISIAMVESVKIKHYGSSTPVSALAAVSHSQGLNRIAIDVFNPANVKPIENALIDAGLNAYQFSSHVVCVNVPPMSGEQRTQVEHRIHELGEEARVALRNIRRNAIRKLPDDEAKINDAMIRSERAVDLIVREKVRALQ